MKNIIDCLDVSLSRRAVIKLCEKYNIGWLEHTNVNGGKYIECIVGYDYSIDRSKFIDIYYKCLSNKRLYKANFDQTDQDYKNVIIEYFKKRTEVT